MQGKATVECLKCKATRIVPMEKYVVGDVLRQYAGGGNYGRCLRCGRSGLIVTEVPKLEPIKPVGWRRVPEE